MSDTAKSLTRLTDLWRGMRPLPETFWWYGVTIGFFVNFAATFAALIANVMDAPPWLALLFYFAPTPYNAAILVAVWRSADRWRGDRRWAVCARIAIAVLVVIAILA